MCNNGNCRNNKQNNVPKVFAELTGSGGAGVIALDVGFSSPVLPWGGLVTTSPKISFSGNNITIDEPGWYGLEFMGMIEADLVVNSIPTGAGPAITFNYTITPVSGVINNLTQPSFYIQQIGNNVLGSTDFEHFSTNFKRLVYIPAPVTFQMSISVVSVVSAGNAPAIQIASGGILALNGNYTLSIDEVVKG
jgi:hypothetical protein